MKVRHLPSYCLPLLLSIAFQIVVSTTQAQSNLKCRTIAVGQSIQLDTLLIDPASITLTPARDFDYQAENQTLTISPDREDQVGSTAEVCYRVANPLLYSSFHFRSLSTYNSSREEPNFNPANRSLNNINHSLFQVPGLRQAGSITRGVTVGNRQNLFVNSSLNLSLQGTLTDDLSVSAVITDRNVPYQPEGNTQQLRDFDNVFIRLYNQSFELKVGDVVLTNPVNSSHFLKFYKNVRGARASLSRKVGSQWQSKTTIAASAAKGRFASISLDPIEGVQGPYRLRGPEGERFIIVLANSERVFIDGRRLERGFQKDYVIDYNLGEIIFNTNILITRFTRIRVDFEFTEQNYGRSNLALSQQFKHENHQLYFGFYREKDNPNNTLGFDFSNATVDELRTLGDDIQSGLVSGVDSVGFLPDRILYQKLDTLVEDTTYEIFKVSNNPEKAQFSLRFSQVGSNQGNYVLLTSTSNGRTFGWVAPLNGTPQGDFEPVVQLAAPNQRQMTVLGSESHLGNITFNQEFAWSQHDQNLFSPLDDQDNQGLAWNGSLSADSVFTLINGYQVSLFGNFEFTERYFRAIDRFRYIEFDRDWSFRSEDQNDQLLYGTGLRVMKSEKQRYEYQFESRNRGEDFRGTRNRLFVRETVGPFAVSGDYFLLESRLPETRSEWGRSKTELKWRNSWLNPGYVYQTDQNKVLDGASDSVISTAMNFVEHLFYLEQPDSSAWSYRFTYSHRNDRLPQNGELVDFTRADNFGFTINSNSTRQKVQLDFNYRDTRDRVNQERVDQLQGRLNTSHQLLDKHIRNNFSLAISSGRELEREFIYVMVNTGEGTHTWRDENEDNVQDLNEFYEAVNPDERQFIKLFTPTDQYITAFRNQYVHSLDIYMPRSWKKSTGLLKMLSKISYLVNFNLDNKTANNSLGKRLNPYAAFQDDAQVISRRNRTRYTVFYNRIATGFGLQLAYEVLARRQLNTSGFESNDESRFIGQARMNLGSAYNVKVGIERGSAISESNFLLSRNFDLSVNSIDPSITWQPTGQFRVIGTYKRERKKNVDIEGNGEHSTSHEWRGEMTFSKPQKGNLNARLSLLNIDFEGEANSFLGYTLLNGLQPGRNLLINLNWQQQIIGGLQLTLQYFGRRSGETRMIHTGTFQLTAFF